MGSAASAKASGKPLGFLKWSESEDSKLIQAVSVCGTLDWKQVAKTMGCDRTDQECFHRWSKVLFKTTVDPTQIEQNKPVDAHDIVGLYEAYAELQHYAEKYPGFRPGLLRECQEQIRRARQLISDSDVRGASGEDLIKIAEGMAIDVEPFLELEEKDIVDPKIDLECLKEAKKLAVKEKKFDRAGMLLRKIEAAQEKLDAEQDRKIGQIMKSKKLIKRLKEYVKDMNQKVKECVDEKSYMQAATLKRKRDRALKAHHSLIKFVTRFTPNKVKEASEAEMMKKVLSLNYHQYSGNMETLAKNLKANSDEAPPDPAPFTTGHPLVGDPVTQGWRPIDDPAYRRARKEGDRFYREGKDGKPLNIFGGIWREA